jgi:hypothetical protein
MVSMLGRAVVSHACLVQLVLDLAKLAEQGLGDGTLGNHILDDVHVMLTSRGTRPAVDHLDDRMDVGRWLQVPPSIPRRPLAP